MYKPYGGDLQTVAIQAVDGVVLQGWYIVPEHQNGQAVILLHGIGDNRGGVAGYGQAFLRQGYRILLPDSRAHGESGGTVATYGLLESDDVRRWVSWLYGKGARCVDGFGESMGAALVLESLRPKSRFCAVVADSPFSDFRSVAYDREGVFRGSWSLSYGAHCRQDGWTPACRDWISLRSLALRRRLAAGEPGGCREILDCPRAVDPRRGGRQYPALALPHSGSG